MKKLTKQQTTRQDELVLELRKEEQTLKDKLTTVIGAMEEYNAQVEKWNEQVSAAEQFGADITSDMQAYMDEKSERWLEGDNGSAYSEWKDAWDDMSYEQLDPLELPNEPETDEFITSVEELPSEPG